MLRAAALLPLLVPAFAAAQDAAPAAVAPNRRGYVQADVDFLTGMIAHHAQAVMIAKWAPSHGAGSAVQDLCGRIVVSQRDEIRTFQRWLSEHGLPVPEPDTIWRGSRTPEMTGMVGMSGTPATPSTPSPVPGTERTPGMERPMLMPGMLTAAQLVELDSARGPDFDKLFLLDMIQHHQGAIQMVHDLLAVPGAAQDNLIYRIASDVNVDQTTEIERMRRMLMPLLTGGSNQ